MDNRSPGRRIAARCTQLLHKGVSYHPLRRAYCRLVIWRSIKTVLPAGKSDLIQAPWYENGEYRGLVEIAVALPEPLPHFVRKE